jgi:hypothetical protein
MKITTATRTLLTTSLFAAGGLLGQSTNQGRLAQDFDKTSLQIQGDAKDAKDYTFSEKDKFTKAMKCDLAKVNENIDTLDAKINTASASTKAEAKSKLEALRVKSKELGNQIDAVPKATESTWEGVKTDTKDSYSKLKSEVAHERHWISKKIGA